MLLESVLVVNRSSGPGGKAAYSTLSSIVRGNLVIVDCAYKLWHLRNEVFGVKELVDDTPGPRFLCLDMGG